MFLFQCPDAVEYPPENFPSVQSIEEAFQNAKSVFIVKDLEEASCYNFKFVVSNKLGSEISFLEKSVCIRPSLRGGELQVCRYHTVSVE